MSKEKSKKKFTIHHQPAIAACWLMMNGQIYCVDNQQLTVSSSSRDESHGTKLHNSQLLEQREQSDACINYAES